VAESSSERNSPSVGLLISVLVRYPEIARVHYDHRDQSLKFSLLLSCGIGPGEKDMLEQRIRSSLDAYLYLENRSPSIIVVNVTSFEEITVIEMVRDVASITQEEISMVTEVVKEMYPSGLVAEGPEGPAEEDPSLQEEMIEEMLDDLRHTKQQRNLVAFREEGRVLVYNK